MVLGGGERGNGTALGGKDLENASATLQNLTKDLRDTRAQSIAFIDLALLTCAFKSRCWRAERGKRDSPW